MTKSDDDRVLVITRVFAAPRALVWAAWSDAERMKVWMAPKDMEVTYCEGELRPGGAWRFGMRAAAGPQHRVEGVYREVVAPERLVFTHSWLDDDEKPGPETVCTVTFAEEGQKTRMTFHQARFVSVEERDSHREGWSETFDKLDLLLTSK